MSPGSIASARAAAGLWPLSSSGRLWGEAWRAIGGRDARHHPADLWYEEVSIAIRRWLDAPRFLGCLVDRDIQGQYWGRKRRVGGGGCQSGGWARPQNNRSQESIKRTGVKRGD